MNLNGNKSRLRSVFFILIGSFSLFLLFLSTRLYSQIPSVITVSVGNEPRGAAYDAASNQGVITNHNSNSVTIVSASSFTTTNVTVGSHPYGVGVYASTKAKIDAAYVTNEQSDTVSVINLGTNAVSATIAVGSNPRGIAVNPSTGVAVVANSKSDTVSVLNLSNNTVTATLAVGTDPEQVVINTSNNSAYVTNFGSNTVSVIDMGS